MTSVMHLALYQPDIPQNTGTLLRLGACLGVAVHIVEPCGFVLDDRRMRRAGMDYLAQASLTRHVSWERFEEWRRSQGLRLVLLTTVAADSHVETAFRPNDILLVGRESAGVPASVRETADLAVRIPMQAGLRSLNVALAAALVLGEALRQTGGF